MFTVKKQKEKERIREWKELKEKNRKLLAASIAAIKN